MNADEGSPERLRQEAYSVAIRSEEPFLAWSELRRWSFDKGPAGAKAAAEAFIEAHGNRPEAAAVMPELSRIALLLPEPQRRELLELVNGSFSSLGSSRGLSSSHISPFSRFISALLPKKETALQHSPKQVRISPDIAMMIENRNLLFQMNRGGQRVAPPGRADYSALPAVRRGAMTADTGHALVHSLSERLSMHGHEFGHARPAGVVLAAKKRPAAKKTARRKSASRKAKPRARKSVRKKSRQK
jgi:hypothetical protein